jgi:serpin B
MIIMKKNRFVPPVLVLIFFLSSSVSSALPSEVPAKGGVNAVAPRNDTDSRHIFSGEDGTQREQHDADPLDAAGRGAASVNGFAFDFYKELIRGKDGYNVLFSPLSISLGFGMFHLGCDAQGKEILNDIFHYGPQSHDDISNLTRSLKKSSKKGNVFEPANMLWASDKVKIPYWYLNISNKYYRQGMKRLDFTDAPQAVSIINDWIEKNTRGQIKDSIDGNDLPVPTDFVLTNTIYFLGRWASPFDPSFTSKGEFFNDTSQSRMFRKKKKPTMLFPLPESDDADPNALPPMELDMMYQKGEFLYLERENFQAVRLDYESDSSMVVLLPGELDGISALEAEMDHASFKKILSEMEPLEILLYMPKFTYNVNYKDIMDRLDALSGPLPVVKSIRFLGVFSLGAVLHQANITVDESGTEAAAGTVVVGGISSSGSHPPIFSADHPFLYFIIDNKTAAIMFMGRFTAKNQ